MKVVKYLLILLFIFCPKIVVYAEGDSLLYYKNANIAGEISNEIGAITFDADIYRNTDTLFANLRLFDENKKIIPYLVRVQKTNEKSTVTSSVHLSILDFEKSGEDIANIILENKDKKLAPSEFNIKTSNKNFEKSISVYGSNDKEEWQILAQDQPIFDYSKFIDLRNTTVSFKKVYFKYYKISINKAVEVVKSPFSQIFNKYSQEKLVEQYEEFSKYEKPFRVNAIKFFVKEERLIYGKQKKSIYPLKIIKTSLDEKKNISHIYLNSDKQPLDELIVVSSDTNFKRIVIIEASNDIDQDPKWISVGSSEIFNIKAGLFHKENLKISLRRNCRYLRYRLKIINQDNAPIKISSIKGKGLLHEILFFHNDKKFFKVYYGGQGLGVPKYDISSVLREIQAVEGGRFTLGEEIENKECVKKKPAILSSKAMLVIALTIMVAVLGYLLVFSVNKVDKQIKD